eukprot:NODE_4988_length_611_cov_118.017794_g4302_i0.p1 GENE.NODE_4988_length_611_cov_118.017794_g4302_i0~~NODE_4988_length_611_cov_118.017794_g4302_i0.p1  ORF type:complete len:189 (+),score=34.99 NODE_4988_length_611_cov_118.017794_g4302_i0:40-567(+)
MGIDLVKRGRVKSKVKKAAKSNNLYQHLLVKLFRFLSRRTGSAFCATVLRRLISSRVNRPPISISRISKFMKGKEDRFAVVVGPVVDDIRVLNAPKINVAALRFSESARARITKAGGQCITLDQLMLKAPTGTNTVLLRGNKNREAKKHFGAPGVPRSHVKPFGKYRTEHKGTAI